MTRPARCQRVNVATLVGQPFTYDPVTGTVLDNEAAQAALHQEYRQGWSL